MPEYRFCLLIQRSTTVDQIYKLINALENIFYEKSILLDVNQGFDRVWRQGLLHKLNKTFPKL